MQHDRDMESQQIYIASTKQQWTDYKSAAYRLIWASGTARDAARE
jgi:hypothetical protein